MPSTRVAGLRGRLPKKPPAERFNIRYLSAYLTSPLPPLAYPIDVTAGITDWRMLGNGPDPTCTTHPSGVGNSTFAGLQHYRMAKAAAGNAYEAQLWASSNLLVEEYLRYDRGRDEGANIADLLMHSYRAGEIVAFAPVDHTSAAEVDAAMAAFHGVYVGVNLTDDADQLFTEGQPWNLANGQRPDPDDGQCMVKVKADGSRLDGWVTWGAVQESTLDWTSACLDEAWVVITEEDAAAATVDIAALRADIDALHGTGGGDGWGGGGGWDRADSVHGIGGEHDWGGGGGGADSWDGGGNDDYGFLESIEPVLRGDELLGPEGYEAESPVEQSAKRFFLAELEDQEPGQPLARGEQYAIAFSVGPFLAAAIAAGEVQEEVLAPAFEASDVLALSVELDSDDFEIFGDSERPLRVPRTGRSLGKARFDIAPRHDGPCVLAATITYQRNFVHQLKLTIPVGGDGRVEVSSRGRSPDSVVALEPRSISIWLEPWSDGKIRCKVSKPVSALGSLGMTPAELALAVDQAHGELMKVISWPDVGEKVFQTRIDIPADAQDMALQTLARAGSALFKRLFFHPGGDLGARRIGEWLSDQAMNQEVCLTVQVVADQAPLPWGMLYLGDASKDARLDWKCFLGMRHIVEQLPLQPSLVTQTARIPSRPELAISLNVNTSIDDPAKGIRLVAGHRRRWMELAAARPGLSLVSRLTVNEVVDALASAGTRDQVVYFYCHASASARNSQDPVTAAIIMGKDDKATLEDLNLDAPDTVQLAGNPLVFINACESAELSPRFYNGFVPYFMSKGARGVIGTECKTPALFAVEWANAFFDQFLDGAAVGETVLRLRQDFLREHGNPLGLIYALHCDADTRVTPALARARTR